MMNQEVRESSLETYHGLGYRNLGEIQKQVINAIIELGGGWVSRRQIAERIADAKGERVINTGAVSGRVNELVTAERLEENKAPRQCPITGRGVHMVRIKEPRDE